MDQPKHESKKQKLKKTKRGKGKRKKGRNEPVNFSLIGTNSNGLSAKLDSLKNNLNIFAKPSCVTIQESKLRESCDIDLPGYQVFQLNRPTRKGGGLLTIVDVSLDPVLVAAGEDCAEVLVVQVKVGQLDIRVFNAYGPQEDETNDSLNFWLGLEKEIIKAKQNNCCIILEMDANAKIEAENNASKNGQLLLNMCKRQNLEILNKSVEAKLQDTELQKLEKKNLFGIISWFVKFYSAI